MHHLAQALYQQSDVQKQHRLMAVLLQSSIPAIWDQLSSWISLLEELLTDILHSLFFFFFPLWAYTIHFWTYIKHKCFQYPVEIVWFCFDPVPNLFWCSYHVLGKSSKPSPYISVSLSFRGAWYALFFKLKTLLCTVTSIGNVHWQIPQKAGF